MPESQFHVQTLADQIDTILSNPQAAEHMAQAALSVGRPDAAEALAEMVETLAAKR
jgi:UDP-N-acetylglucosamine--N-acetylmuramyl-(pentapeptide) pyrophosphoryl-undecaprenol N-acetylglucosamine transferase